ncbi:MAG TPA: FtsQ-type POTRA domain-containing protein [Acidobacteriota bacterium]|nr:FtsQ-type POTRA domain-containing protein [Acidobacteriota bacterium]
MATAVGELGRERKRPLFARRPLLRPGERDLPILKKGRRRRVLKVRHVAALLVLQAAFFFGLRETYSFVLTWDYLTIRKVDVVCAKPELRQALQAHFATPRLGNILLCDLAALRADIRRLAWVKDASVQKVFPSALRVTVTLRTPFALLERGGLLDLADEEGRVLEPVYALDEYALPVFSDAAGFSSGFFDKWAAAGRCYLSLPADERARLFGIRSNDGGGLELMFKDDPVRIIVGRAAPAADLARFRSQRARWEEFAGPLAAVDMSFEGRVFLRTAAPPAPGDPAASPDSGQGD